MTHQPLPASCFLLRFFLLFLLLLSMAADADGSLGFRS